MWVPRQHPQTECRVRDLLVVRVLIFLHRAVLLLGTLLH